LYIFGLLYQNIVGVFDQGAFEKQEGTVFFEGMYQDDIFILQGVTRAAPFQFFMQLTVERDEPQLLYLCLPLCSFSEVKINFRVFD
jgi:hypothetical protein